MYFMVEKNKPWFVSADKKTKYPCKIDALGYEVFNKQPHKITGKIDCLMTVDEIRAKYNLCVIDVLDTSTGRTTKSSNKVISSLDEDTTSAK